MNHADLNHEGDQSQEAIALLQEEVARLEAEVRARDDAVRDAWAVEPADHGAAPDDGPWRRRLEELSAELAGRDETIAVLLEQTQHFEEAVAAQRAEWEQLNRWVQEVERRVEGRDGLDAHLGEELEAERRRAETLGGQLDSERRAWDVRRRALEGEVDDLRRRLAGLQAGGADGSGLRGQIEALERENRRLRDTCAALEQAEAAAAEVGPLRERLAVALAEAAHARAELLHEQDDRARERNEHQAALGAMRSQLACESLQRPAPADDNPEAREAGLEADERIRAFRQHLQDLHHREEEERAARSLSSRISRLWRHTGPG
jgi:chromosome segregation ATPase